MSSQAREIGRGFQFGIAAARFGAKHPTLSLIVFVGVSCSLVLRFFEWLWGLDE